MSSRGWTSDEIPPLRQRVFVVTGASSGLGLATTRAVAAHGGRVVMAVRDEAKGRRAASEVLASVPDAQLDVETVDLADVDSVRRFAQRLHDGHERVDVLINNAGTMAPPRTLTATGHEVQFAANHLGHFALTGLLLDLLTKADDPRVVTISSLNHRQATMRFDDLTGERGYAPMAFYNMSKLANAIFGYELHRRLTDAGSPVRSVLAHPGYTATNLQFAATTGLWKFLLGRLGNPLLAQPVESGAWSQLYAATDPAVRGGDFVGPDGRNEMRGHPTLVQPSAAATDAENGRRLWEISEKATGVHYVFPAAV
ncbi:oxidoreductase [Micromonospora sp. WMMD1120]|uniref:oxidoreductase n=1 Tax=Micromonospora sp. WMMD1120 TaxID=3016106 RepID=UPI00241709D7|nr:oxidoreductase [Micromonospora sp. WMMD1120]MDG4810893.1 oxidoreductase [Micromonospora sp. WMMD1120]